MSIIGNLSSLIVPNKTVETEYPGMPGFKIKICFMSREAIVNIRKRATKTTFKNRQATEEFDEELFLKLYVEHTIKDWDGLKISYLEQLVPINTADSSPDDEVGFSPENALSLMKSSPNFDAFITEQVTDLGNFTSNNPK